MPKKDKKTAGAGAVTTGIGKKSGFLLVAVALLIFFHILPLVLVIYDVETTDGFDGPSRFASKLAGAVNDFAPYDILLRKIMAPLMVGVSAATSIVRVRSLRTLLLVIVLVAGIGTAAYSLLELNGVGVMERWMLHPGHAEEGFGVLKLFALQTIEAFLAYLALALGVAVSRSVEGHVENA